MDFSIAFFTNEYAVMLWLCCVQRTDMEKKSDGDHQVSAWKLMSSCAVSAVITDLSTITVSLSTRKVMRGEIKDKMKRKMMK